MREWLGRCRSCLRAASANPTAVLVARTVYYLAILVGLVALYGKGDFSTPSFIYQGY